MQQPIVAIAASEKPAYSESEQHTQVVADSATATVKHAAMSPLGLNTGSLESTSHAAPVVTGRERWKTVRIPADVADAAGIDRQHAGCADLSAA